MIELRPEPSFASRDFRVLCIYVVIPETLLNQVSLITVPNRSPSFLPHVPVTMTCTTRSTRNELVHGVIIAFSFLSGIKEEKGQAYDFPVVRLNIKRSGLDNVHSRKHRFNSD